MEPVAMTPLLETLNAYRGTYPGETPVVDRIVSLVNTHADCCERTCRPGHLTGSAWVMSADHERHLLLLHRKLGKWLQPGGHADGEADLAAVALREAQEESGLGSLRVVASAAGLEPLDVDVHAIPARYGPEGELIEDAHEHHDLRYLLITTAGEDLVLSEESHALRWCTPAEVRELTDEESVLRLLDKAICRMAGLAT